MPAITSQLRTRLLQQRDEMRTDDQRWCPFDDEILALAWRRSHDLDPDEAIKLHRELWEAKRLIELGGSTSNATTVSVDELVSDRGYTRKQLRQLDDDCLLAIVWDRPATRRKGYVLRSELDALPGRLQAHAEEQARQRKLKADYIAGRRSKPVDDNAGDLPDCLR